MIAVKDVLCLTHVKGRDIYCLRDLQHMTQ